MLTADLAQSWQRGGRVRPLRIPPDDAGYLQDAARLIHLFGEHEGRARRSLNEALEEYVGTGTDYRIMRGFIKLLMDRCAFETAAPKDPVELRRALFRKAREFHPLTDDENVRMTVATEAARELECAPEILLQSLYADLPENQILIEFESIADGELLNLYNLAQAQALLYRCVEMRLYIEAQNTEAYREIFGAIKAYRLIHTIEGNAESGYEVRLDGPVSMFHRSQKYGVQMAVFLPALLLCEGWRMRAEISGEKHRPGVSYFELQSRQKDLRSHYSSTWTSDNPAPEKFASAWKTFESEWQLEPSREVIDLGESAFIPDFALVHHSTGRRFYLEILGFWTPRYLDQRLKEFAHAGIENFALAAWDELRGSRDPLPRAPAHTIIFKKNLEPSSIETMLNQPD